LARAGEPHSPKLKVPFIFSDHRCSYASGTDRNQAITKVILEVEMSPPPGQGKEHLACQQKIPMLDNHEFSRPLQMAMQLSKRAPRLWALESGIELHNDDGAEAEPLASNRLVEALSIGARRRSATEHRSINDEVHDCTWGSS